MESSSVYRIETRVSKIEIRVSKIETQVSTKFPNRDLKKTSFQCVSVSFREIPVPKRETYF